MIITGAETDLSGNPITSTLSIPTVDSISYNAPDDLNVLRVRRNGRDDIVTTFGEGASRGVSNTISATINGQNLASITALRAEAITLQDEIEAAVNNQKLEDHHGVQPVFRSASQTQIPAAQRDILANNQTLDFRLDNRIGNTT